MFVQRFRAVAPRATFALRQFDGAPATPPEGDCAPAGAPHAQPASRDVGRAVTTPRTSSSRRPAIAPGTAIMWTSSLAASAARAATPGTGGRPAPVVDRAHA